MNPIRRIRVRTTAKAGGRFRRGATRLLVVDLVVAVISLVTSFAHANTPSSTSATSAAPPRPANALVAAVLAGRAGKPLAALAGADPNGVTKSGNWICGQLRTGHDVDQTARIVATYSSGISAADARSFVQLAATTLCARR
jgi:hypothetical protein